VRQSQQNHYQDSSNVSQDEVGTPEQEVQRPKRHPAQGFNNGGDREDVTSQSQVLNNGLSLSYSREGFEETNQTLYLQTQQQIKA